MTADKIKYVSRFLLLVFMIFAIAACGGGGGGGDVTAISGNAVKGPVRDAQIILLYFDDKGEEIELPAVNAPVKTNADGSFVFNISANDVPGGPVLAILRTIGGQTGPDNGNAPMLESVITDLSGVVSQGSKLVSHMSTASSVAARLVKLKIVETGSVPDTATTNELLKRVEQQLDVDLDEDPSAATSSIAALNELVDSLFALKVTSANINAASEYIDFLAANLASKSGELDQLMKDPANPGVDVAVNFGRIGNGALADLYPAGELQNRILAALNIADLIGPSIVSAIATSNTEVIITFTEELQGGEYGVEYTGNYVMVAEEVPGAVASSARVGIVRAELIGPANLSVRLTTQSQTDIRYSLQVTGMLDLAGNPFRVPEAALEGLNPSEITVVGVAPRGCDDPDDTTCVSEIVNSDGDKLSDSDELRGWTVTTTTASGVTTTYAVTSDPNTADTDNDGVPDDEEKHASSDPRSADTDGDTLTDNMEWNVLYSDPTNADTDGDGTQDGFEFISFRTSPVLADTDGDQISDTDEILARNRSPRIADLPEAGIMVGEVRLQIDERYTYEDAQGNTVVVEESSSSSLTQSSDRTFATSSASLAQLVGTGALEIGYESNQGRGSSLLANGFGPFVMASGIVENTTSNTFSTDRSSSIASQKVSEKSRARVQEFDTSSTVTREIIGARIDVDLTVFNRGNVAFTISNIEVTMLQRDRQSTGRFVPVATLIANSTLLTGGYAVNDESASYNLGPFNTERGPFLFSSDSVFPNLVDELMKSPGGLIFKVSNFDISDELGRVFDYSSQIARDRTAGIIIDYGDGTMKQHLVATAAQYDAEGYGGAAGGIIGGFTSDGTSLGIPLDYALQSILKLTKGNTDGDGILAGIDGEVQSIASGDDIQVIPLATTGLNARNVVIAPGQNGVLDSTTRGDDKIAVTTGYETSATCDIDSADPGAACTDSSECSAGTIVGLCNGPEILTRLGNQRNGDNNRKWVLFTNQQNSTPPGADFGQIQLKPRADLTIAFLQDLDEDGLFAREEYMVGSIDSGVDNYDNATFGQYREPVANDPTQVFELTAPDYVADGIADSKDTDRDGIGDFAEVRVGWKVQNGGVLKQTYSSPRLADSDGDGLLDFQEKDLRVFCQGDSVNLDPRSDALCAFEKQDVIARLAAVAIIAGPGGVADTTAVEGDEQLFEVNTSGLPYGAAIIGEGEVPGIQTEILGGNNLYDDGFIKPPATDPSLTDTDNDGISDKEELLGFIAGLSIRDDGNQIADTLSQGDDLQVARFDTPTSPGGIIILPGPNGELETAAQFGDRLNAGRYVVTDPLVNDTDTDSVSDGIELALGGDPMDRTDGVLFRDSDQDGISDSDELLGWEVTIITAEGTSVSLHKSNPSRPDSDFDGLPDYIERDLRTNPNNSDTDGDGLSDFDEMSGSSFERYFGLEDEFPRFSVDGSASEQYSTYPTKVDSDGDTLTDYQELIEGYAMLDPVTSQFQYIYTNPLRADSDFDGRTDIQEKNRTEYRTFPSALGDGFYNWYEVESASGSGNREGAIVLCKAPCTLEGKTTKRTLAGEPYGYLAKGITSNDVEIFTQINIQLEDASFVDIASEPLLSPTDATNRDTDGDGQPDGTDGLPLVPDRSITVEINSIAFQGTVLDLGFIDNDNYSAGWWVTVTQPDGSVTKMSDADDLRYHEPSIVFHDTGEFNLDTGTWERERNDSDSNTRPSLSRDANDTVPSDVTLPGESAGTGGGCNGIRYLDARLSYLINLSQIDDSSNVNGDNNPKNISLLEGESFRLDGLAAIFTLPNLGTDILASDTISDDCGRAPAYIPTSVRSSCVARLSKTFSFDDFSTLGIEQQSMTISNDQCSIELIYTVKR
jgi:hypothetical protein